jgi:hypothetical protein
MRVSLMLAVVINLVAPLAYAATPPPLQITRVLPDPVAPQTDAHDEAVELRNAGAGPLDLAAYTVKVGTHTYHLPSQTLAPDDTRILTAAEVTWSLANAGGSLTLADASGAVIDTVTWPAAKPGQWWTKQPDGNWAWAAPDASVAEPGRGNASVPLELSELLPNPASPQTDAKDEFVEIYNPTDLPVELTGYSIKTGSALTTSHAITGIVPAAGYLALTSGMSHITLANAGGLVALFDPSGTQVGPTVSYGAAADGQAWARFEAGWAWTTIPTPGTANQHAAPGSSSAQPKAAVSRGSVKSAKITAAKPAKATKAKTATSTTAKPGVATAGQKPSGTWLLFALAGLTIAYVIYEFRYDLRHFYHQLRGHADSRTPAG